jgi:hypothetical protein
MSGSRYPIEMVGAMPTKEALRRILYATVLPGPAGDA